MKPPKKSGKKTGVKGGRKASTTRRTVPTYEDIRATSSHWILPASRGLISDPCFGFVYRITRISDGKDYIGRKNFITTRDHWPYYMSSGDIKADILDSGIEYDRYFEFEMLMICGNISSLKIAEAELQIAEDCIHNDNNYNWMVGDMRWYKANRMTKDIKDKVRRVKK